MNATQYKMARAALGLGAKQLAKLAGVTTAALKRLEKSDVADQDRFAVRSAFESRGIEFYENQNGDFGVIVKPFTISIEE